MEIFVRQYTTRVKKLKKEINKKPIMIKLYAPQRINLKGA